MQFSRVSIIFISILFFPNCFASYLSKVLQLCDDGSCVMTKEEESYIQTDKYKKVVSKYLNSGVSPFLWDYVRNNLSSNSTGHHSDQPITEECVSSLVKTLKLMDFPSNQESLKMLTSTGKTPRRFFAASTTSLGDYDACLSIVIKDTTFHNKGVINGKHCLVDLFPARNRPTSRQPNFFYDEVLRMSFTNLSLVQGVCVPDSCSRDDVRQLMKSSLKDILLKPNGFINCDTRQSTSFLSRVLSMSIHQFLSITLILIITMLVGLGSLLHAKHIYQKQNRITSIDTLVESMANSGPSSFSQHFSVLSNTAKLFKVSSQQDNRYFLIDIFKFVIVLTGCWAHALVCVEVPIGFFLLGGHQLIQEVASTPHLQMLFNDSGLVIFAFLAGFVTFMTVFPMMKKMKKFPFGFVIFDRWLRFIPSIMSLVCLEFVWPLLFDGPFMTRVGNFVKDKCSRTWFLNVLFIQNWFPVLDICGGQTFFSAVDLQLFVLGLLVLSVMVKSQASGVALAFLLSSIACLKVVYNGFLYESTMTFYTPKLNLNDMLGYLDYIHMTTPIYIPSYFMGLMNGE